VTHGNKFTLVLNRKAHFEHKFESTSLSTFQFISDTVNIHVDVC